MYLRAALAIALLCSFGVSANAQQVPAVLDANPSAGAISVPEEVPLAGISVAGTDADGTRSFVIQAAGLTLGQTLMIPGDPARLSEQGATLRRSSRLTSGYQVVENGLRTIRFNGWDTNRTPRFVHFWRNPATVALLVDTPMLRSRKEIYLKSNSSCTYVLPSQSLSCVHSE